MVARGAPFTRWHRGGSGTPLVAIHGFTDTWRCWELILPALERQHDVLAPTLAGHAGGPALPEPLTDTSLVESVEAAMDEAGFERAHIVGNSLGGFVALQLAARGRAESVVAFAPAGGWAEGNRSHRATLAHFGIMLDGLALALPALDSLLATKAGRRAATQYSTEAFEHIPAELIAHQAVGAVGCGGARTLIRQAIDNGWRLDDAESSCPVRVVWGASDRLLPWPDAAVKFRDGLLAGADWVVLEGVGHCPQLDVPDVAASLILEFTASSRASRRRPP